MILEYKFLAYVFTSCSIRKMSVFVQKYNAITGISDWLVERDNYDYHQEVARSSFADMLHDTERNLAYESALKDAIEKIHARGKLANVLDIGTGTGLLSMMAVRHGADTITACEAFFPMSDCAKKIIKTNGFSDRIKIISKRSTDLTVGPGGDLNMKCNILVTEVFDSELIGEGALATFKHAHSVLLEPDCIVVPHSAIIYAQIIESSFVQNWNKLNDFTDQDGRDLVQIPTDIKNCSGSAAVHDIQINQIPLDLIKFITSPIPVFKFDWSGKSAINFQESNISSVQPENEGVAQAVFVWWSLQMDTEGKIILDCSPYWAHPLTKQNIHAKLPWRDHWMQAIYYLPNTLNVTKDMTINLISSHDEYSLWFAMIEDQKPTDLYNSKPICTCGLHMTVARTRIGQINDNVRSEKYLTVLKKHISRDTVVLVLGDSFYISLAATKLGAKKIYFVETNTISRKILFEFINHNNIKNAIIFESFESLLANGNILKINLVIGEPYFLNSILPWDHLFFTHILKKCKNILTNGAVVFPKSAVIKCIAVKFSDLHKIRLPLKTCQGFFMKDFDELIQASSRISDENVEAQPLWEYPCIALSKTANILKMNLSKVPDQAIKISGVLKIEKEDVYPNGIAFWIDWLHDEDRKIVISTGPVIEPQIGQIIQWDKYTRQGVYLFEDMITSQIDFNFTFDFNEGNIAFKLA